MIWFHRIPEVSLLEKKNFNNKVMGYHMCFNIQIQVYREPVSLPTLDTILVGLFGVAVDYFSITAFLEFVFPS